MNLGRVQKALAVLLTDPAQRTLWYTEPESFALDFGLSEEEKAYLAEVSAEELRKFADGLVYKRLNACRKLLPEGARTLGADFNSLFFRFAADYCPTGIWKHGDDSVKFAEWLQTQQIDATTAELFRFEGVRLAVARGGFKFFRSRTVLEAYGLKKDDILVCWRWKQGLRAIRLWPLKTLASQDSPDQIASEGAAQESKQS